MIHVTVPLVPPSANELRRKYRNPFAYRKLRRQWEHDLFFGVACARFRRELIDQADGWKRIRVEVTIHHSRRYDDDNAVASLKPVLDALKEVGYIRDDAKEFLDLALPVVQVESKERKTVLKIGPAMVP